VDTYGVPRYQEANPGLFTMVTFPYMFGFMFGDIGHGFVLALAGFLMIRYYQACQTRGLGSVIQLRYLFFIMGCFACFCGVIYNDFMGIPWKLFGSCYTRTHRRYEMTDRGCTYWAGFDPAWLESREEITFVNSLKMKLSVIAGVLQMTLGIVLKGLNAAYFRNLVDLCFEFVP
jgi:V-type H+-transporting ATPase subunit a